MPRITIIVETDSAGRVTDVFGPDNYDLDDITQSAIAILQFMNGEKLKSNMLAVKAKQLLEKEANHA